MKRAFNYTDRKRIPRESVDVVLHESADKVKFALTLPLDELQKLLPGDARIYVEAYRDRAYKRFPWGTVAQPRPVIDTDITDLGYGTAVLFRVKIVDESAAHGLILAHADRIRATIESDVHNQSLLPVIYQEGMGQTVWRLKASGDQVALELNRTIPGIREHALTPAFAALVYPAALRQVLLHFLLVEQQYNADDATENARLWLLFAEQLCGEPPPSPAHEESHLVSEEWDVLSVWIEEVVDAFCSGMQFGDRYRELMVDAEEGR